MSLKKKLLALGLVGAMVVSTLTGCGGGSSKTKTVSFMYGGDSALTEMFNLVIEEFNKTEGAEKGVKVKGVPKAGSIDNVLAQQLPSNSGPDIVATSDKFFKKYTSYFEDLSSVIDQATLDDYYDNSIIRYHYNTETTTSYDNDPLYGIPGYNYASFLYYNTTVLDKLVIICISVD